MRLLCGALRLSPSWATGWADRCCATFAQGVRRRVACWKLESRQAIMHTCKAFVYNHVPKYEGSGPISQGTILKGRVPSLKYSSERQSLARCAFVVFSVFTLECDIKEQVCLFLQPNIPYLNLQVQSHTTNSKILPETSEGLGRQISLPTSPR